MNRELVLHHLTEAHEALTQMIQELRDTPDYGAGELFAEMPHLYHHLNTAWNAREASPSEAAHISPATFRRWSSFPDDLLMFE
jgi:hypothetical protein